MDLHTLPAHRPYVTLRPGERFIDSAPVIYADGPVKLWSGQLWVGYQMGALLEGNVKVYCRQRERLYLGGVYFHKHERYQTRQDFYKLEMLDAIKPLVIPQVCMIEIDRDIVNVDSVLGLTVSCWDVELLMNFGDREENF
jgi:hypothetical protein